MKKVKQRWRKRYLLYIFAILFSAVVGNLGVALIDESTPKVVRAEPASPSEERGIWVDRFRIVLYNNLLDAPESGPEVAGLDGQTYSARGAGEDFYHPAYSDGSEPNVPGPNSTGNRTNATDEIINEGGSVQFKNADGCATLTVSYSSPRNGTLSSSCSGRSLSSTSVILEDTDNSDIIAYKESDTVYKTPVFIQDIVKNGVQAEDSNDVHIKLKTADNGTAFTQEEGDDPGNTGGAPRDYVNCETNTCYSQEDKPGAPGSVWLLVNPTVTSRDDRIIQIVRRDLGTAVWGSGDVSESRYMSGRSVEGGVNSIYDAAIERATEYQRVEAQKGAYRDLFDGSGPISTEARGIALICWNREYEPDVSAYGSGDLTTEEVINTLAIPKSGPFFSCLKELFETASPELKAALATIDSIKSVSAARPPVPTVDGGDCGGGIPIISDLICNLVKWAFNVIYEMFTWVIEGLTNPPDVLNDQGGIMDQIWGSLRNIANVFFLLAFLLVIFQYVTNVNVADAYFVKKFIPRLIIAVVLVQASGWIARELMYLFDDLGKSIQPILFSAADITRGNGFEIGGGAATVAAFASPAIIGMLAIFAIAFLIILLITIVVLSLRYVAILILAIFAPIAFGMLAIPQLEGTFKKWLKTYVTLLAMYPIIMAILAASSIVAKTLNGGGTLLQLMAMFVQFIPFVILPFTFKMAGGMMGKVSGALTGLAKKGGKAAWNNSGTKAGLDRFKGMRKQGKEAKTDERVAKRLAKYQKPDEGRSRFARAGRRLGKRTLMRGMDEAAVDRYAGGFADKVEKQRMEEATAQVGQRAKDALSQGYKGLGPGSDARSEYFKDVLGDPNSTKAQRHVAFEQMLATDAGKLHEVQSVMQGAGAAREAEFNDLVNANFKDVASVRGDVATSVGNAQRAPGTAPKSIFDNVNTAEKIAGQKKETLAAMANEDAVRALHTIDSARADPTHGGKVVPDHDVLKSVVSSINRSQSQLDGHSTDSLQRTYDRLQGELDRLSSTPGSDPAEVSSVTDAMNHILNKI